LIARLRDNSELKLERAWLVMGENLRQNIRFNFGAFPAAVGLTALNPSPISPVANICCSL
jgi:hypothetical protein